MLKRLIDCRVEETVEMIDETVAADDEMIDAMIFETTADVALEAKCGAEEEETWVVAVVVEEEVK